MKKILIIVDMQNDFIDGVLANPSAKAIVPSIVDLIDKGDYDYVFCTMDTHHINDYDKTIEGEHIPLHCKFLSEGWQLNKDIAYKLKEMNIKLYEICKKTFGSYSLPRNIDTILESHNIVREDIEIDFVGTCTGICVINNVAIVKSYFPNATINVYEDLCACLTQESHNRAIEQMRFNHINIKKWKN